MYSLNSNVHSLASLEINWHPTKSFRDVLPIRVLTPVERREAVASVALPGHTDVVVLVIYAQSKT